MNPEGKATKSKLEPAARVVRKSFGSSHSPGINILNYLASCSDASLFAWVAVARISMVVLMLISHHIFPLIVGAAPRSLIFDTSSLLYDDPRFTVVRNWDSVHMFFIASHGYVNENQLPFFPGLPILIRAVDYFIRVLVPPLVKIAPTSFYICMINVMASCGAAVLLRRLTVLTFFGPEALFLLGDATAIHQTWSDEPGLEKQKSCEAAEAVMMSRDTRRNDVIAVVRYRLTHGLTGTIIDDGKTLSCSSIEKDIQLKAFFYWRAVGAAILVWIITPAMVFTVAIYTESLFSLTTIAAIYLIASYEPLSWDAMHHIAELEKGEKEDAPSTTKTLALLDKTMDSTKWVPVCISFHEIVANVLFLLAATLRSNAFVCAGFFIYPLLLQICFPAMYHQRCRSIHFNSLVEPCAARTLRALYTPRRFPGLLRIVITVLESFSLLVPYLMMNYLGYVRFVLTQWTEADRALIGKAFWRLYPILQKKYWGVSFLSAYHLSNIPNVFLALPITVFVGLGVLKYYRQSSTNERAVVQATAQSSQVGRWDQLAETVSQAAKSSNVVYLGALLCVALMLMNIQVTNRFVMCGPALYWLLGFHVAHRPQSLLTCVMILWSLTWSIIGGCLFANFFPWT